MGPTASQETLDQRALRVGGALLDPVANQALMELQGPQDFVESQD